MYVLLNLAFALLLGWLALWLVEKAEVPKPIAVLVAVIIGILVYMMNLAGEVL